MVCSEIVYVSVLLLTLTGCNSSRQRREGGQLRSINEVSEAQWQALATRKIFFGHQSVGRNILEGIRELQEQDARIRLKIISSAEPEQVQGPALVEYSIGRNGDPKSKEQTFASIVERGLGQQGGIAMYKYCYLDTSPSTNPEEMFARYRTKISALQGKYPELIILHVSSPLTSVESPLKYWVKKALLRSTDRDLNVKRNRYNELLREEYGGKAPIFDLAEVESTRPDGSRSFLLGDGKPVYILASEYTDDGGHLNQLGRRVAAEQLLIVLSSLPMGQGRQAALQGR